MGNQCQTDCHQKTNTFQRQFPESSNANRDNENRENKDSKHSRHKLKGSQQSKKSKQSSSHPSLLTHNHTDTIAFAEFPQNFDQLQEFEEFDHPSNRILSSNLLAENINICNNSKTQNKRQDQPFAQQSQLTKESKQMTIIQMDSCDFNKKSSNQTESICSQKELRKAGPNLKPKVQYRRTSIQTHNSIFQNEGETVNDNILQPDQQAKNELPTRNLVANSFDNIKANELDSSVYGDLKNFILSENNLFQPIEIRTERFVNIQKKDPQKYYRFLEKIGQGTFGNVYKAQCLRTQQTRAIKVLKRNQKNKRIMQGQISNIQMQVLRTLDHPNIVRLFEVYSHAGNFYLITEYCKGGSILTYLRQNKNYCENIVKRIMKQLLNAMCYLHSRRIIHRDIKLENIVFIRKLSSQVSSEEDVQIKIIDFGQCLQLKFQHNNRDKKSVGTMNYMAPQVIEGLYSQKCDVWSCGVILYILLSGKSPFKRQTVKETIKCIQNQKIVLEGGIWDLLPKSVKVLTTNMLQKNPLKRITSRAALQSSWFTERRCSQIVPSISKGSLEQARSKQSIEMNEIVQKLYHYYRGNNLTSVVQSYLSFLKITQQERTQISKLFAKLDTNSSGAIQIQQLRKAFALADNNAQFHDDEIQYVLAKLDKDQSKSIGLNEFISAIYSKKQLFHQQNLQIAFDHFDTDQNGVIDKAQLKTALKGCKEKQFAKIMSDLDENGDEMVSRDQFLKYFTQKKYI